MARAAIPGLDVEGPVQAEVFTLFLADGTPQLTGACGAEPWYIEVGADEDPVDVVAATVGRVLGEPVVVHSTSWRRDRDAVILSFVVVIRPDAAAGLVAAPVGRAELARGGVTTAPSGIAAAQVIEHGLRHLAWLASDDPVVADRLDPDWHAALRDYLPEPFRHLRTV